MCVAPDASVSCVAPDASVSCVALHPPAGADAAAGGAVHCTPPPEGGEHGVGSQSTEAVSGIGSVAELEPYGSEGSPSRGVTFTDLPEVKEFDTQKESQELNAGRTITLHAQPTKSALKNGTPKMAGSSYASQVCETFSQDYWEGHTPQKRVAGRCTSCNFLSKIFNIQPWVGV